MRTVCHLIVDRLDSDNLREAAEWLVNAYKWQLKYGVVAPLSPAMRNETVRVGKVETVPSRKIVVDDE